MNKNVNSGNPGRSVIEGNILVIDDDEDILTAARLLLKRHYRDVVTSNNPEEIPALLAANAFDVILLDMNFSPGESNGEQGFIWLAKILAIEPQAVIVLITAHGGVDVAVDAMKLGATDFISKPWQNEKVVATLSSAYKLSRARTQAESLKKTNEALTQKTANSRQAMLGSSPAMKKVQSLIERSAPTSANVLILGENGTGKELAARAIHQSSDRSDQVFISIDLGSVPESLFESELFGHTKGAFTDAKADRIGMMQAANGGTLFLDEIGNIPLHLQAKLLTVLERREISPVGSNRKIEIDVRIIAATNVDKIRLADENRFRQDLLFRLNTVEITMPPLRERKEDIPELTKYYADIYTHKYGKAKKELHDGILSVLLNYRWPGNIRALRHAMERAVILSEGSSFTLADFQLDSVDDHSEPLAKQHDNFPGITATDNRSPGISSPDTAEQEKRDGMAIKSAGDDNLNLEQLERKAIEMALKKHRYNISHSAKDLGLTRAALYRRMEKHGL